jgi:hypothetical protein
MARSDGVTGSVIVSEDTGFPGFGPKKIDENDLSNYRVKYAMVDLMDPGSRAELEIIETKAVKGQGVIVLTKDKYSFMDKFFIVISYLEMEQDADTR